MAQTSNTPAASGSPAASTPATPVVGKWASVAGKCAVCGKTLPLQQAGAIGATCLVHLGKVGCYQPAPVGVATNPAYITVSALCKYGKALGVPVSTTCNLCGGDKGLQPITNPVYQPYVTYTASGQVHKYVSAKAKALIAKLAPATTK